MDAGLVALVPQLRVQEAGFLAFLDLGGPVLRLAFETDGFETHGSRQALAADCLRHTELLARGWLVARLAWEHVMFRPDWVVDRALRLRDVAARRNGRTRRTAAAQAVRGTSAVAVGG